MPFNTTDVSLVAPPVGMLVVPFDLNCARVAGAFGATLTGAWTTKVPVPVGPGPLPWQSASLDDWTVKVVVPVGVVARVAIVRVFEKGAFVVIVAPPLNEAVAPAGGGVVTLRVIVQLLLLPLTFTATV
jgi:hypothetical protein